MMSMLKLTQTHFPPETLSRGPRGSGPEHPWAPRVLSALYIPERAPCSQLPIASTLAHYL